MKTAENLEVEEIEITGTSAIVEFDINVARINEIRETSKSLIIVDNASYVATKELRTEVVTMRTTLEKARKKRVDPLNKEIKLINEKAKELTALIEEVEEPLQVTVKSWEAKKEEEKREKAEAEQKRIEAIQEKINSIRAFTRRAVNKSASEIMDAYLELEAKEISLDDYQELTGEADRAKDETLALLKEAHAEKLVREIEDAERKAAAEKLAEEQAAFEAKKAAEQKEADRVAAIKQRISAITVAFPDIYKNKDEVNGIITELKNQNISTALYEEYKQEAEAARDKSIALLETKLSAIIERENFEAEKAKLKAEQEKLEAEKRAEQKRKADEELARLIVERAEEIRPDKERIILWLQDAIDKAPSVKTEEAAQSVAGFIARLSDMLEICESL